MYQTLYWTRFGWKMTFFTNAGNYVRRHFCFAFFLQEGFGFLLTGPFLPCDDLFGWWSLRCGVWIVFLLAVVGNGIVLFVSITARSKLSMDVPRFLICNLACADFMMGAYLGILAILDASTLGMTATLILSTFQSPLTIVEINVMIILVLLWEENPATIFFYKHIRFRWISILRHKVATKWRLSHGWFPGDCVQHAQCVHLNCYHGGEILRYFQRYAAQQKDRS